MRAMIKAGYGRALWFLMSRGAALAVLVLLPIAVQAGWLDRLFGPGDGAVRGRHDPAFEAVIRHVRALPVKADGVAVAAQATPEGHWRFLNRAGEIITAGTPEEMKHAVGLLFPESRAARPLVYVAPDTIFSFPAALKALLSTAELFVVAEGE